MLPGLQEFARRKIAYSLVGVLAFEILAAFAIMAYIYMRCGTLDVGPIKEILQVIFAPTVALVASATGFYFGAK